MARNNETLFPLRGALGPVTFYKLDGNSFAKRTTSLDKEKIETAESMKRTRENDTEMGGAGTVTKATRRGFSTFVKYMTDRKFTGRLTKALHEILILADGVRGERPLNISEHKELLADFDFNCKCPMGSVFQVPFNLSISPDRLTSTLTLQTFNPKDDLYVPQGASHVRFINAVNVVSNYQYDATAKKYYPTDSVNNMLFARTYSDYIPVNSPVLAPTVITATISGTPVLGADVSVVNAIGIEFSQEVNLVQYLFAQNNAMMIRSVF
ncbi:MAG: hypothetical protein Q8880_09500 [Bacteroidota bacterium]|nr:hypothetical protein [Bacteroidota bacterium]